MIQPAVFREGLPKAILCRSWIKKKWDQTRKFVKEHKKEIIIGAVVVVVVAVVTISAVAICSSAAAVAATGSLDTESSPLHHQSSSEAQKLPNDSSLAASLQEQISNFKETIAPEQLRAILDPSTISIEENGRILGSLFTHKTIDTLTIQAAKNPSLSFELQNLENHWLNPTPTWAYNGPSSPHASADLAFSTNYSPTCSGNPEPEIRAID